MDMIRTGMEECRYSFIISEYGTNSTRGGGIVVITRGGGRVVIMAREPGTPLHSITSRGREPEEVLSGIVPTFLHSIGLEPRGVSQPIGPIFPHPM
jgi:hypothetical protein